MGVVYLESSALVAWLLAKDGSEDVASRLRDAGAVVTSSLTFVEARRAILRLERDGKLNDATVLTALGRLERLRFASAVLGISPAIEERASRAFPREPVRTLDAIHLATALECTQIFDDLRVLSLDRRLLDNAEALGL